MKKIVSLVLVCIMLIASIPFSISAADDAVASYGPQSIFQNDLIALAGMTGSIAGEGAESYYHCIAERGTYQNNSLQLALAIPNKDIMDYPYIRICYKTDSASPVIDISARSDAGESWMNGMPAPISDGKWHDLVIKMTDLVGGAGVPTSGATLVLKPFNSSTVTLTKDHYFDIKYIAMAKTESALNSYVYTGEETVEKIELEVPDGFFYELADQAVIDKYVAETDALIEEIYNTPTDVEVKGTSYYVSNTGDDSSDGKTPETAWATVTKVNSTAFENGDAVFFKRGDTWRITSPLQARSGVTYSAYGEGSKPKFLASLDSSGADKWSATSYENIWRYNGIINGNQDVGTIVFDGGEAWGIQVQKLLSKDQRLNNGKVFNGRVEYMIGDLTFKNESDLKGDLEFYHNWETQSLYLYCADGNPGDIFASIEIVDKGHGISLSTDKEENCAHDIVIDNLEIFGAGSHGIGGGNVKNVIVQNCVLTWIGGSIQGKGIFNRDYGTRYGNAVESYGSSENFIIRYCYASQVYDCCWTVQCQDAVTMNNIQMYKNVTEFCNTGLEVWNGGGTITNMQLHDNYTRYNGYGWSHQRPNKDGNFFYGGTNTNCTYENNDVYNNVNYFTSRYALLVAATGTGQYNFHDNVYIMENDKYIGGIKANPGEGTGNFRDTVYSEQTLARAYSTGFEKGTKFYYTEPKPFENMYDMYEPFGGANDFTDVADNFWGREAVNYVARRGLFKGVTATEFAPDGKMTRAMLVTVLSRLAGKSAPINDITYTDVNKDAWYVAGVAWAEANGIVKAGGKFRPDENATREELADMLYKFALAQYKKVELSNAKSFTDSDTVTAEYADGVKFCTANGIIGGYSDGSIKPKANATRAEVATMIKRFISALSNLEYDVDAAIAGAEIYTLSGDELAKTLDKSGVRATLEADGTVKLITWLTEGSPCVSVMDSFAKDFSFVDYGCAVVNFKANLHGANIVAALRRITDFKASFDSSEIVGDTFSAMSTASKMLMDYSGYATTVDKLNYNDSLLFRIYPWGINATEIPSGDYMNIESIVFFDDVVAARAYAGK